jgi:hypothetical protein
MAFPHDGRKMKKGETLNPHGRPRKLPELDKLLAEVLGDEKGDVAKSILESLIKEAKKGNVRAAEVLLDRAYGKPKEKVEVVSGVKSYIIVPATRADTEEDRG